MSDRCVFCLNLKKNHYKMYENVKNLNGILAGRRFVGLRCPPALSIESVLREDAQISQQRINRNRRVASL